MNGKGGRNGEQQILSRRWTAEKATVDSESRNHEEKLGNRTVG